MAEKYIKVTIVATIFLIALGGYTTSSGSGMGCSDVYPLCDSGWLPDFNKPEQFTEFAVGSERRSVSSKSWVEKRSTSDSFYSDAWEGLCGLPTFLSILPLGDTSILEEL